MSLSTTQYGYIVDPMVPFTDDKGKTIKNGFIRVFMAGTSTPVITYRNYDGATNQEKIELDNSGRVKHNVIGSKGSLYKVVVYNILHSQENPLLTVDKIAVLGASINASGATIVTGLDSVTVPEDNFLKATVEGTGVELALDPTEVTSEVSTIGAAETAAPDYVVPLLDKTGEGDGKKISLANLFKFALDRISRLATTITSFASGDFFAVSNTTDGTRKMSKDTLFSIIANENFVNDSYLLDIPVGNVPVISESTNSYSISFPETTGGADANKFYIFSPVCDTIVIDYSSYVSDGKYEVTLAKNEALVYKVSTGELLKKFFTNNQFKSDYILIAANVEMKQFLFGPIQGYHIAQNLKNLPTDEKTRIFNVPRNQLPSIEKSGNSFVVKFPLGTGADAGKMYLFSSSKDTITMDYSSNVSDGVYKVTLATNESLVYDFKTNSFLKKYFVTSQYKGDYYLIAANSSGTLYGPLTKYYDPLRIDALEKEVLSPNTFQLWGNYGFLYGMQTSGYGAPIGTTSANRYSDFIPVKKGDVVIANTCISNSGLAIAFYTSNDFDTIVGGVLGRDNTKLEKYIYVCPADGYISGSTSTYAYADALNATIQITTPENSEIGYASSDTPPYEFLNYNQLTKAGAVLTKGAVGSFDDRLIESPCVWYDPNVGKMVMVYTAYEGQGELSEASASIGYAYSDDGVTWTKQGQFYVPSGVSGAPDENGLTGPVMVLYGGKYYFFYIGLTEVGYEAGTKTLCLAVGDSIEDFVNNTATRKGAMISPLGVPWTAQWYAGAVYHPTFIFKGGLWYCFFNASGKPIGKERIGFAVAESLEGPWNVNTKHLLDYIDESAVTVGQIAIDPSVVKMGTYFVMGYGFRLNDIGTFGDCWAFTEDCNFPYGWQYGGIGVKPSASGYDSGHAVKPFLLKHSGLVYHYYSAAGSEGNCIGLIK